jgi:hypothetical protein
VRKSLPVQMKHHCLGGIALSTLVQVIEFIAASIFCASVATQCNLFSKNV